MTTPRTTVVNVKYHEYDVYIGRAMPGFPGSVFANDFKIGRDGTRAEVLEKYRDKAKNNPALLAQLEGLRGRRIGCWCRPKQPVPTPVPEHWRCHGDILVELLGETPPQAPSSNQGDLFT